ncbi:MAG: hypothetical protein NT001_01500 [Candidatus Woesearchaeota archaeon]|nr:hypothetical protein [Candidatus Woesearchaeota archaeon]
MEKGRFEEKRFFDFVSEQSKLIRGKSFDLKQIEFIIKIFSNQAEIYEKAHGLEPIQDVNKAYEILFEFQLSLQIAYSNYRKENKTMWTNIFGWGVNKIPQIDINDILKK